MPVINLAGSLGGAGDAAAAVTQQLNVGMQQMLQLAQLQEQRRARQADLDFRMRAFSAELDATNFSQQAQLRAEQRALRLDEEMLKRSERDFNFLSEQKAKENALALDDFELRERLADSQIAAREAELGAKAAQQNLVETNLAGQVGSALGGRYPVSASGAMGMLRELWDLDAKNGTNHAETWEATLHQMTGGEYRDLPPEEIVSKLEQDPRLFTVYTALGQGLLGVRQSERAKERAVEMTAGLGAMQKRVAALGDKRLAEEFDLFMQLGVPQEDTPDGQFLDYADDGFLSQMREWDQRIGLAETKGALRGQMDAMRGQKPAEWWGETVGALGSTESTTRAEAFGKALEKLERAQTADEARGAVASVMPLLDPTARLVYDMAQRQALGAAGGGSVPMSGPMSGVVPNAKGNAELLADVMDHLGFTEFPEEGSEEEAVLESAMQQAMNARAGGTVVPGARMDYGARARGQGPGAGEFFQQFGSDLGRVIGGTAEERVRRIGGGGIK